MELVVTHFVNDDKKDKVRGTIKNKRIGGVFL